MSKSRRRSNVFEWFKWLYCQMPNCKQSFRSNLSFIWFYKWRSNFFFDNIDTSFSECNFSNNTINGHDISFGGGISLVNASKLSCRKCYFTSKYYLESNSSPNITIDECLFTNNTTKSHKTYCWAIFYEASHKKISTSLRSSLSFNNVTFKNNKAYSYTSSIGGAISIKTTFDYFNITFISSFQKVTYMNNTAYSESSSSFGGVIWFSSFCSVLSIIPKFYFISDCYILPLIFNFWS